MIYIYVADPTFLFLLLVYLHFSGFSIHSIFLKVLAIAMIILLIIHFVLLIKAIRYIMDSLWNTALKYLTLIPLITLFAVSSFFTIRGIVLQLNHYDPLCFYTKCVDYTDISLNEYTIYSRFSYNPEISEKDYELLLKEKCHPYSNWTKPHRLYIDYYNDPNSPISHVLYEISENKDVVTNKRNKYNICYVLFSFKENRYKLLEIKPYPEKYDLRSKFFFKLEYFRRLHYINGKLYKIIYENKLPDDTACHIFIKNWCEDSWKNKKRRTIAEVRAGQKEYSRLSEEEIKAYPEHYKELPQEYYKIIDIDDYCKNLPHM